MNLNSRITRDGCARQMYHWLRKDRRRSAQPGKLPLQGTDRGESPDHVRIIPVEVDNLHPHLVLRDKEGKPYTLRYDQVTVMLLHEFRNAHRDRSETICKLQGWPGIG